MKLTSMGLRIQEIKKMSGIEKECFLSAANFLNKKKRFELLADSPFCSLNSKGLIDLYNQSVNKIAMTLNNWFVQYEPEQEITEEEKKLIERNNKILEKNRNGK